MPRPSLGAVLVVLGIAAAGGPAAADGAVFNISFTGTGHYTANTTGHTQNDAGRCFDHATEDSRINFGVGFHVRVSFGRSGMSGGASSTPLFSPFRARSHLTLNTSGPGCDGGGSSRAGTYDCRGKSETAGRPRVQLTPAGKRARSTLRMIGPVFNGARFTGSWQYSEGSCKDLNDSPLLSVEYFHLPLDLAPRFPISESTLANLREGHYFKVDVREGHYAPRVSDAARCAEKNSLDSCRMTFTWSGQVRVRRTG